jgi:hypothetical protein
MSYTPSALALIIAADSDTPRSTTSNNINRWYYNSPSDSLATCQGSGYFSDGVARGMAVGDIVEVAVASALKTTTQYVSAVTSTAATISAAA